ncbi:MAG: type II toxin-antitoxin system RelE/ParE family toxin [Pseudomonadota bacterium]
MKPPVYKLRIPDEVAGLIRSLHPHLKLKIRASLQAILSDPHAGKALKDELAGLWSFRVSRFRIVYRISGGRKIGIVAIGPRERIYRETFLLIKKGRTT